MAYKQTTKPSAPQGSQLDPESRSKLPFLKMNFILMHLFIQLTFRKCLLDASNCQATGKTMDKKDEKSQCP